MTIKLISIDMDATLLRDDKTYDKERFELAARQLLAQGVKIVIASGNSYHKLIEFFDKEFLRNLYFAADNGNYIIKDGQLVSSEGLTLTQFHQVMKEVDKFPKAFSSVSVGMMTYITSTQGKGYENVMRYNNEISVIPSFDLIPQGQLVTKNAIYYPGDLEENKAFAKHLDDAFEFLSVVTSGEQWVDAYVSTGGKGRAIEKLQDKYQISPQQSMAFGDSLNDLTMMQQVTYSMAMENADDELKDVCDYQVGSNQDQAVITVLEKLVKLDDLAFLQAYRKK